MVLGVVLVPSPLQAADNARVKQWEKSIVTLEVTRKIYDYQQPWTRRSDQTVKSGVVTGPNELLTTAEYLQDRTLIRVQKGGRGKWFEGDVAWIDYHANLAIVTVKEPGFWRDLAALPVSAKVPTRGQADLVRWRNGALEAREVNINRLTVKRGKLTYIDLLQMEIDTEMAGIGWSETIIKDGKIVGLSSTREERSLTAIPSHFIKRCLDSRRAGAFPGLGYFAFVWQRGDNPPLMNYFKLPGEPRGVVVSDVPANMVPKNALHRRDVILEIDGLPVDSQGDYKDADYGNLLLENLATHAHWAGDKVHLKVWREGREVLTEYQLPKADYKVEVVPDALFDTEPEYLILGGLVFQPLTIPYLQSWGADYQRKAPFRLSYASQQKASSETPSVVVLSAVLPDSFNIGYQEARWLLLDQMNGRKISNLRDIQAAIKESKNGFHVLLFQDGDNLRRAVLDANSLDQANERILKRYGIDEPTRMGLATK